MKTHLFPKTKKSIFSDIGKLISIMKLNEKILKFYKNANIVIIYNYVNFERKWALMP